MHFLFIFYSVSQYILIYQHSLLLVFIMMIYSVSAVGFISGFCLVNVFCKRLKAAHECPWLSAYSCITLSLGLLGLKPF